MGYVSTFFSGTDREQASGLTDRNRLGAYGFVEAPAEDGEFIRYSDDRSTLEERLSGDKLTAVRVASRTARYGVEWANISTAEDAKYWIAGTRLRVIDLETQEILAERIGYVFDKGQGSTRGERDPWQFAKYNACPTFPKVHEKYPTTFGLTRNFVQKVLKP
jgi:hypothetical protein